MEVIPTEIPAVKVLCPKRHGDHRGFFSEVFNQKLFREQLVAAGGEFVQDNHSMSGQKGVLRGLHYQIQPAAQCKLVRVVRGAILDVAVDIRRDSPTLGRHVSAVLSAEHWRQRFVPIGFAHGFVTLEPDCEVIYKVSTYYSPQHERGIRWNDPRLGIDWGIAEQAAVLSQRDREHPMLSDARDLF